MFKPKYTISQKLLKNIKRIAELASELNSRNFSKLVLIDFEKSAREISSHSSTRIEGNPLPLTEVKKILKHTPENIRDSEREVLNYNEILIKLNEKVKNKNIQIDLEMILHIQEKVTNGLIEKWRSGHFRVEPVVVNNSATREVAYLPPESQDVLQMASDLVSFIQENQNIVDPLIIAGIFHKQFVIIHPFVDGNGRTARLLTKILLAKMGLNTFNLFSFENYYNKNVSKYFETVGEFGNYYEICGKIDFTLWLEYFTDGVLDELLRVLGELEKTVEPPELILSPHLQKLIGFMKTRNIFQDRDYAKLTTRSKSSRNLDFNKLIELGIIERLEKGKKSYYKIK